MRLDIHSDPGILQSLAGEWRALLATAVHCSIFATPEWAATWWKSFGESRRLCVMTLRDDGTLIGIVPLFVETENGQPCTRFLGGVDVTDYEDIIALPGREPDVWSAALAHLDGEAWQLDLHNVPGQSPTVAYFRGLNESGGRSVVIEREDVCPLIRPLPASWDAYLENLDKKNRHEVRRKQRRLLGDEDVGAEVSWRQSDLQSAMADFVRLHRLSSADKDAFMTPRMVGFFNDVAAMCQERDWLCLAFISTQGVRVSTIMAFEYGDTLYLYNSGYDPSYEYLSVGLMLKALAIEYSINKGLICYDFLQGNERYKYDLGGRDGEVVHIVPAKRSGG